MNTALRSVRMRMAIGFVCAIFTLAMPASAAWIALRDFNGWWTDDLQNGASVKAKEVADQKMKLNDVAFAPSGDWVVLFGGNGYWTSDVNLHACKKLTELQSGAHTFKCVAFAPNGGWVVFYDLNGYAYESIPAEAVKAIEQVANSGGALKWFAFAPGGGWCLFHGRNSYVTRDIPGDCFKKIQEVSGHGSELETVSFSGGTGWVFFFDKGGFYAGNIPDDAFQRLVEQQKTGTPRAIAFAMGARFDPKATYVLEEKPARHIHATLSTDIALPNGQVDEWYLYAPEFPNLPSQREMKTTFEPAGQIVRDESALKRPLFLTRLTDHRKEVRTVLTIDGTLYSRQLRVLGAGQTVPVVKELLPEQAQYFTRVSPTSDIETAAFRNWVQRNGLTRAASESELVFAHRVFAFIVHHNTYQWPTENHTATQVCTTGKSDCGGLSALFTGVMRANGIPTRLLGGRWASSQKPGNKTGDYGNWHVKAEFFAHGVGWVPVDGASALSDPDGENTFFGHDHGDHVAFVMDEDMVVNSFVSGPQKVPLIQGVLYWWRGRGNGDNSRFEDLWTVQQEKQ
ncbi:transglutaminase domain protein [Chthoniobacter flavus Ellin428]|uniref:Transglutaminase domain protein n=1 Tax=Chthoniobacter flavus Ellin428 TaxID=497964 RepID=B4D605_9BACT|nr:transglutaminase domain-containing protein [Chthoniobacter flavus]EDY18208.1 transglutaminase domain protein [Chthoniobacter flavus Ellin428]TCO91440.1 transglutaminase superfamily protein [Chthoniobacter flavus]